MLSLSCKQLVLIFKFMTINGNSKVKTRVTSISFEDDTALPFYKKWWFWLLLVVGAIVLTAVLYIVINFGLFSGAKTPISPLVV